MQRQRRSAVGDRVDLVAGRAEQLPFADDTFDGLTFTYLLRYVADPVGDAARARPCAAAGRADRESRVPRAAQPVLALLVVAVHAPRAPARRRSRRPDWFEVGRFLGPSISKHYRRYPIDWTIAAWRAAGITDVTAREMSLGAAS